VPATTAKTKSVCALGRNPHDVTDAPTPLPVTPRGRAWRATARPDSRWSTHGRRGEVPRAGGRGCRCRHRHDGAGSTDQGSRRTSSRSRVPAANSIEKVMQPSTMAVPRSGCLTIRMAATDMKRKRRRTRPATGHGALLDERARRRQRPPGPASSAQTAGPGSGRSRSSGSSRGVVTEPGTNTTTRRQKATTGRTKRACGSGLTASAHDRRRAHATTHEDGWRITVDHGEPPARIAPGAGGQHDRRRAGRDHRPRRTALASRLAWAVLR